MVIRAVINSSGSSAICGVALTVTTVGAVRVDVCRHSPLTAEQMNRFERKRLEAVHQRVDLLQVVCVDDVVLRRRRLLAVVDDAIVVLIVVGNAHATVLVVVLGCNRRLFTAVAAAAILLVADVRGGAVGAVAAIVGTAARGLQSAGVALVGGLACLVGALHDSGGGGGLTGEGCER